MADIESMMARQRGLNDQIGSAWAEYENAKRAGDERGAEAAQHRAHDLATQSRDLADAIWHEVQQARVRGEKLPGGFY